MAKVGRVAAGHHHRHRSINSEGTPDNSVFTQPLSRRGSRVEGYSHRRIQPQIVVDPPPPEESLYPSLTTLGSLDDDEDEDFSCKDSCKSGLRV